ncbi:hypothetical protein C7212DRAFT_353365 [Tuber magnatum]|uniref:Uncharacterized protein n=1 Tax=Tuber magnatum TaxID=42249 RepID=A0A317SK01_9PEZI|nr:hypothetical protein C7212DRAFT_353365 [Tuber magnatum]
MTGELVAGTLTFPGSSGKEGGLVRHAAGFMALATVDFYIVAPPTCIHVWFAHFAEVIVKAHLCEIQGTGPADLLSCTGIDETEDPSVFVTPAAAWEVIMNADAASHALVKEIPRIRNYSNSVVAASIAALAGVGAPSWGHASNVVTAWPQTVAEACEATSKSEGFQLDQEGLIFAQAKLSMLRASCVTIMLRAAGSAGPGLEEGSNPITGLAYMA